MSEFIGGEQLSLWFLAVSTLRNVDMLVLDEPTNHMDRFLQEKARRAIRTFPGAVVLSTHDRNLMNALTEDSGHISGTARYPIHLVLEKNKGRTTITHSKESPAEYITRVTREALQEAKKFKV